MTLRSLFLATLVLAGGPLCAQPKTDPDTPAPAEKAKATLPPAVAEGYKLIHSGQIEAALQHFRRLLEADPQDAYAQKAVKPLIQATLLRKVLQDEKSPKWLAAAEWLNRFYTANKVAGEALALAERVCVKFPDNRKWKLQLASCQLAGGQAEKALAAYESLLEEEDDDEIHALAAILHARQGRKDKATDHLASIGDDAEGQALCYNIACAFALLGEAEKAGHCLKRSFELTPPSQLAGAKEQAKADADLASLKGTELLAQALAAKSTVGEPATGGCAGCSQAGGCDKAKEGGCDEKGGCGGEKKAEAPKKQP